MELGCGDASFLVDYARRHPERNFIGVERLLGRLRKLDRKGRRAGLTNLRGVRIESSYFLEYLLPPHSVSALHVYFPDPWPNQITARAATEPKQPSPLLGLCDCAPDDALKQLDATRSGLTPEQVENGWSNTAPTR